MEISRASNTLTYCLLLLTVFITGASVLIIELVGTRLLAPFFGSGIYTWSALIAVTLAALAVGYVVGGRLAHRMPRATILYLICFGAGAWTVLTPWAAKLILPELAHTMEIRSGVLLASSLLFFPNLFLLGTVGPFTIRLLTQTIETVGAFSGLVFSVSTIGSLLGALLTGFLLIPNTGTQSIFVYCGALLLTLALTGFVYRKKMLLAVICFLAIIATIIMPGYRPTQSNIEIVDSSPSFYGLIHVARYNDIKMLLVDGVGQNYLTDNSNYTTPYIAFLGSIPTLNKQKWKNKNALIIGLGAGQLVGLLHKKGYSVDAVEIDPVIARMATQHFALEISEDKLHLMDGRVYLAKNDQLFDYIVIDAFNADQVAGHLLTVEALELVRNRLTKNGTLAINLTSQPNNADIASLNQTLKTIYPEVRGFMYQDDNALISHVFIAGNKPLRFTSNARFNNGQTLAVVNNFLTNEFNAPFSKVIFSDDYNPIDHQRSNIQLLWRREMQAFFAGEPLDWMLY